MPRTRDNSSDYSPSGLPCAIRFDGEVHYPSSRGKKLSHRARCDLVLTPTDMPLEPEVAPEQTLFDPPERKYCKSADAVWLEVKVAYQFREGGAATAVMCAMASESR